MDMSCDYDLTVICRSCRKEHPNLQSIFDNMQGNGVSLHEMMSVCTQLQIYYNDGMPQHLCPPCVGDINTAYGVLKRSEQSDRLLREYISRRKMDGSSELDGVVKVEMFEIKPDISLVDADPLIGEKCFAVALGDGIQEVDDADEGIIEALDDDGDDVDREDFGGDNDRDSDLDYEVENLEELIEETELEEERPRKNQTRGRKGHGYTRIAGGKFACDSCDKEFTDRRGITNHVKQHEPKEVKLKECPTCGKIFTTAYHLSRHVKIHDEDVQCEHCEAKFAIDSYGEYVQHMEQEHPGKEPIPQK